MTPQEPAVPPPGLKELQSDTFREILSIYPNADEQVKNITAAQLGEFLSTGAIQAWE